MGFSDEERDLLMTVKGVGPTVVQRLEQLGFASLEQLADADAVEIVSSAAGLTGSTCWKNSPQARAAVVAALDLAKAYAARRKSTGPTDRP
ncbi:helix-hairpin-helix domain-containing protein [Luteimonas sp. SDU101]|uniref:helix-hairpin-helix domain-containing protein n=1 Tax=unclassified Luteimonas TaxID=2629088 RepID=UPI003EB84E5D